MRDVVACVNVMRDVVACVNLRWTYINEDNGPPRLRSPRLDALPLFGRNLRPRTSSGIFGPARSAGSSTGVLHHVRICMAKGRGGSVAGAVEEVDVIDNVPHYNRILADYRLRTKRTVTISMPGT